jgi:hypothetical protein
MDLQAIVDELRKRVAKLEAAKPHRRAYNQQEAAREVGMSVNKFREEQRAGRVKGTLNGRIWTFTDEELQRYLAGQSEDDAA